MRALLIGLSFLVSSGALAGPKCTEAPSANWIPAGEMKAKAAALYKVDEFKTTKGNCYEIYGRNKDGRRVEVYFHPLTGAVVKEATLR